MNEDTIAQMGALVDLEIGHVLKLSRVNTEILQLVVTFCGHLSTEALEEIEMPLSITGIGQEWYRHFIDVDTKVILELAMAADYLDIEPLLQLSCAAIAIKIKGKTTNEILESFNVAGRTNDAAWTQILGENIRCDEILTRMANNHPAWDA